MSAFDCERKLVSSQTNFGLKFAEISLVKSFYYKCITTMKW